MKRTPDIIFERELGPGETFDVEDTGGWKKGDKCCIWVHQVNEFMEGEVWDIDTNSDPIAYHIAIANYGILQWSKSLYPPI